MRYQGVNRVYHFYMDGRDFMYVAPDPIAAAKAHARQNGLKRAPKGMKALEIAADRIITVAFDDCAEAIHHMTGGSLPVESIRESLKNVPLANEFIAIKRAAEQWARSVPDRQSRFLRVQ